MNHYLLTTAGVLAAMAVTSCVDDKYDLSDIDTTAEIKVTDLTIPVNIDPITLKSAFDLDPDDPNAKVKEVDGIYAVVEDGSFTSNDIKINPVTLRGTSGEPTVISISNSIPATIPAGTKVSADIPEAGVDFKFESYDVPAEILDIEGVDASFNLSLNITIPALSNCISKYTFRDLKLQFPAKLDATANVGSYDNATGVVTIAESVVKANEGLVVTLACKTLDFKALGGTFDAATHHAKLDKNLSVKGGKIELDGANVTSALPSSVSASLTVGVSNIYVKSFTGQIQYSIKGVNISPVAITELPDILSQGETTISIVNPQVYLTVNSPLSPYNLGAETDFSIVSHFKDGSESQPAMLDNGAFKISSAPTSQYLLCPDPEAVSKYYEGYTNPAPVKFSKLADVFKGPGIPDMLNIKLVNPNVYVQPVTKLPIDQPLGSVSGQYQFYAPLALGEGSKVVYTSTEDGWNDEDVDAIVVERLEVATTVSSDCQFDLDFTGYPIDVNGNQISGVKIEGAKVPAGAKDLPIVIKITGEVTHLDGITFTATGYVPSSMTTPLSPSQTLSCKDIRATVSGHYTKEL